VTLCGWLALYFVTAYLAGRCGGPWRQRWPAKLACAPGLLAHALARATASLASLAPIKRVNLFRDRAPFLDTGDPSIIVVGHALAAVAMHATLLALFLFVTTRLPDIAWEEFVLPSLAEVLAEPGLALEYVRTFWQTCVLSPGAFLLVAHGFLGLLAAFDMRARELVSILLLTALAWLVGAACLWLGAGFSFLSRGWFLLTFYLPVWHGKICFYLISVAAMGCALVLANLAVAGCWHLLASRVARGKRRPRSGGPPTKEGRPMRVLAVH
jgi:hypothetical protein